MGMRQLHSSPFITFIILCPVVVWSNGHRAFSHLCPDLELARLRHVLDAFERFILLTVHIQTIHL